VAASGSRSYSWLRIIAGVLLCVGVAIFFTRSAAEHGRRVNTSKARGDQSGYLWDAENVYHNWHGRRPSVVIGERNRMPLYAGYLALFYDPAMTDPEYFEVGKRANIYLAVGLLTLLALVFRRHLPLLPAVNLTAIATFGWFIYKAGYTQSELLFYTLFFLSFLCCWHLLRSTATPRLLYLAALGGALSALAYLTKAATPPFLALFGLTFAAQAGTSPNVGPSGGGIVRSARIRAAAAGLVFAMVFLAILSPYLMTNKRVFGRYFYNVNSTFYVWYDNWAQASQGTILHGDGVGWPDMRESQLPSLSRYWREHTIRQIAERVQSGLADMAVVSYRTYDYLGYLALFSGLLVVIAVTRWHLLWLMLVDHVWLSAFLCLYAVLYVGATAFYFPISGTGTARFFLAHLLPFFFVLSHAFSRTRLRDITWTPGGVRLGLRHFHIAVSLILVFDVALRTSSRLMTTYGGF